MLYGSQSKLATYNRKKKATEETFSINSQSDLGIRNEVSVALRLFSLKSSNAGPFAMPFRIPRRKIIT